MPAWEKECGYPFEKQYLDVVDEIRNDIIKFDDILKKQYGPEKSYKELALSIEALGSKQIGSGTKTALLATAAAFLFKNDTPENCLKYVCGVLKTDTDTIGSMTGVIIGSYSQSSPSSYLQDFKYITEEAKRVTLIPSGQAVSIFVYPDLMKWRVPKAAVDAIIHNDQRFYLQGLGELNLSNQRWEQDNYFWSWAKLSFGQSVLVKIRNIQPKRSYAVATGEYRPSINGYKKENTPQHVSNDKSNAQLSLLGEERASEKLNFNEKPVPEPFPAPRRLQRYDMYVLIEEMIREAAHSGFSPITMGNHVARILERADADASLPLYATLLRRARYKIRE